MPIAFSQESSPLTDQAVYMCAQIRVTGCVLALPEAKKCLKVALRARGYGYGVLGAGDTCPDPGFGPVGSECYTLWEHDTIAESQIRVWKHAAESRSATEHPHYQIAGKAD